LGSEFLPPLDEGDLLYMPSALPGLSTGKAAELLQQTDRLIATVPEVKRVFGKIGRAETATDPAPLEMVETVVQLKPRSEWRAGMTPEKLVEELDRVVQLPGLSNIWIPPIRNRIDMLATASKAPWASRCPETIWPDRAGLRRNRAPREGCPGVSTALAERVQGGRYIDVTINRQAASRYGMSITDVQSVVSSAIGGENIGETIEGRRPLSRSTCAIRAKSGIQVEGLKALPIVTERGAQIPLSAVATISLADGRRCSARRTPACRGGSTSISVGAISVRSSRTRSEWLRSA
jgi:Cu(I)/Ag(I) efflux system membrane protein CusA/SilA